MVASLTKVISELPITCEADCGSLMTLVTATPGLTWVNSLASARSKARMRSRRRSSTMAEVAEVMT